MNFEHVSLQQPLRFRNDCLVKHALMLHCATAVRHNLTYEALFDILRNENAFLRSKQLPSQSKGLWKRLQKTKNGILFYVCCKKCQCDFGLKDKYDDDEILVCRNPQCTWKGGKEDAASYVFLKFKKSLKSFLAIRGIINELRYRENRVKKGPDYIEDLMDGECYRLLDLGEFDFTYSFGTDGVKIFKTGSEAWPIYAVINELPPHLRAKHLILVGLYIGKTEPVMNTFLKPFIEQANEVSQHGISWRPDGPDGNLVRSRFLPTCMLVDAKARCNILSMAQFNGYFPCSWCDIRGIYSAGNMRFPSRTVAPLLIPELRTHDGMVAMIREAQETGTNVRGHKGAPEIMNLLHFQLDKGCVTDDLHPIFEGVVKSHTQNIISIVCVKYRLVQGDVIQAIDTKMKSIRTPSCISRKTQFQSFKEFSRWKGSQSRNWLFYYGPLCLRNVGIPEEYIHHFEMLSEAVYRLSKRCISQVDLEVARKLIQTYVRRYEDYFGLDQMFYNFHVLLHIVDSVKNWGNLWAQSTFLTESANFHLVQRVSSPKGALEQIVNRYLIEKLMEQLAVEGIDIPEHIRRRLEGMLKPKRTANCRELQPHCYLIGNGERRDVTPEEQQLLMDFDIIATQVTEFTKGIFHHVDYRSSASVKESNQSDDSFVITTNGTFCDLISLVVVDDDILGVFVNEYETCGQLKYAGFTKKLRPNAEMRFMAVSNIDGPAIKIKMYNEMFAVPVVNWWAID